MAIKKDFLRTPGNNLKSLRHSGVFELAEFKIASSLMTKKKRI